VWTAHNVFPHENPFPDLDLKARQLLVAHCDHIVVHCRLAVDRLQAEFGVLPPVSILPHPNFLDEYPSPPDRTAARRVLRIPDSIFLFLMFGWLRDYKGFDTAIATFRKMQLPQVRLHIAGKKHKYFDLERVTSLAEGDSRITVVSESLPADAVSTLFGAADVSLHCFRNILTSGTVALAQSMGTAIIAPRIGCIQEMVSRSCGSLYDPDDPSDLENAMLRVTEIDVEAMGNEGRKSIAHQTMQSFAKKLMNIYRSL
jgi:beta-1,4-mannosyltransferase